MTDGNVTTAAASVVAATSSDPWAMQVGHSANMVAALPDHLADEQLPKHVRHALGDALMVHAALLATWIVDDTHRRGTVDLADRSWLCDLIETTEQHVTTYGNARLSTPLVEIDPIGIRARLLPLVATATQGAQPLASFVANARAGRYPT